MLRYNRATCYCGETILEGGDVISRKSRNCSRRRPRSFAPPMLWYGDTLKTELKARRREELFHLSR